MRIVKTENLSVELNGISIFRGVNMEIQKGERVALIGDNGIGKTTLLKVLSGMVLPAKGKLDFGISHEEIGWMLDEQTDENTTTMEFIYKENEQCDFLKKKLAQIQRLWENSGENSDLMEEYNSVLQQYMEFQGYEWEARIERVAKEVEIEEEWRDVPYSSLSGGQKTRVKLARLLVKQPQMLILDEPTNHMDIESVQWLVKWLKITERNGIMGAILFIKN